MIAYINLTNRCNLHCKMCDVGCREKENTFGGDIGEELDPNQWLQIIEKVGATEVVFNAVEPLLYGKLDALITLLKPRILRLTTNGWLIPERFETVKRFDSVAVSLDGTESIHDHIRGRQGSFRRAFLGLIRLKEAGVPVRVSYAITPDNTSCITVSGNTMKELGIPIVFNHFNFIHPETAKQYGLPAYNTKFYNPKDVNIDELYDSIKKVRASWQPRLTTLDELKAYYQDIPLRTTKVKKCSVLMQILYNQRCTIAADGTFLIGNRCWINKSPSMPVVKQLVDEFMEKGLPEPCHRLCCGGKTV